MNKNLVAVTSILLGATMNISEAASASRPIMIGTTVCELNMRSGPGTSYKVVTKIKKNKEVEVYSKKTNGWYKIKYSGKEGWVNGKYIKDKFISSSPKRYISGTRREVLRDKASTKSSTYGYVHEGEDVKVIDYSGTYARVLYKGKVYYISKQYLQKTHKVETMYVSGKSKVNLMETASSASSVKGSVSEGVALEIVGKKGTYYHVKYNNKWYYVAKNSLSKVNPASNVFVSGVDYVKVYSEDKKKILGYLGSGQEIVKFTTVNGYTRVKWKDTTGLIKEDGCNFIFHVKKVVNAKTVNVMSAKSKTSNKLGTFSKNEKVKVYKQFANWSKVKIGTKYGYVENKYLNEYKYSNNKKGIPLRNSMSNLNNSNVILNIPIGEKIIVEGYKDGWVKVKYKDKVGFVVNEHLTLKAPIEEVQKPIGTAIVKDTDIWVRKTAEWTGDKMIIVKKGDKVDIYEKGDVWTKIGYNGVIGYVSSVYLDLEDKSNPEEKPNDSTNNQDKNEGSSQIKYLETIKITQPTADTRYVITEKTEVYKDSNMTILIGYLEKGSTIESLNSEAQGNVLCKINNSEKGYIKKDNITHRNPFVSNTESFTTKKVNKTHREYVESQNGKIYASIEDVAYYSNPKNISIENKDERYQFLKLNTFRNINVYELNEYLNSIAPKGGKQTVFKNQAQAFVDAARQNNIDPIYLVAHTMLETGYGFSELSQGIIVNKDSNGNSISPVKVHNLYGIGAVDSDAIGGGSRVAYALGWTDIPKAITGAAKWISEGVKGDDSIGLKTGYGYINSSRFTDQYTTYAMRWDWNTGWHQYASDPQWSLKISKLMNKLSYLYEGANLVFEKVEYKEELLQISEDLLEDEYVIEELDEELEEVNIEGSETKELDKVENIDNIVEENDLEKIDEIILEELATL